MKIEVTEHNLVITYIVTDKNNGCKNQLLTHFSFIKKGN